MAESSLRAARPATKGGLPNLLFAVAAAERPPAELRGGVDEVSILFPWGSLLRGVLAADTDAAAGIASLLAPGGCVDALVSIANRDAAALGVRPLDAADGAVIARRWRDLGVQLSAFRPATPPEIEASGSTWARRLRAGGGRDAADRRVWRLRLRCGVGQHRPRPRPRP
jgi:16S rRNA (adenine(1408)-N(1))-methyltransferase